MSLQKKSSQEHRRIGRSLDRPPIGERLTGKRNLLEHVDPGQTSLGARTLVEPAAAGPAAQPAR
jgi:hypothetical protein